MPRLQIMAAPLSLDALTTVVVESTGWPGGRRASFLGLVRGENLGRAVCGFWIRGVRRARAEGARAHRAGSARAMALGDGWAFITAQAASRSARRASRSSPRRPRTARDAFAVCRYAIERVKQILPDLEARAFRRRRDLDRGRDGRIQTTRRRGRRRGGAHARNGEAVRAGCAEIVGSAEIERDVPAGATLAVVWDQLAADFPALAPYARIDLRRR